MVNWLAKKSGKDGVERLPEPQDVPTNTPTAATEALVERNERPKLTLRKRTESERAVRPDEVKTIIAVDGYSVVQTDKKIVVIDDTGEVVKDFQPHESTSISVSWSELGKSQDQEYPKIYETSATNIKIPPSLQEEKRRLLGSSSSKNVRGEHSTIVPGKTFTAENGGSHLLLSSDGETFLCFETESGGERLPPRMWKRQTGFTGKDVPPEIALPLEDLRNNQGRSMRTINVTASGCKVEVFSSMVRINDREGNAIHSDPIVDVKDNLCIDPIRPSVLHYCRSETPTELITIDTNTDSNTWGKNKPQRFPGNAKFKKMSNLKIDSTGRFFTCMGDGTFRILESDTLEPIDADTFDLTNTILDEDGRIRGVDKEGRVVVYDTNLDEIGNVIEDRKSARLAAEIDLGNLFGNVSANKQTGKLAPDEGLKAFDPLRRQSEGEFLPRITAANSESDLRSIETVRDSLKQALAGRGLTQTQVRYVTEGIDKAITEQMRVIAERTVQEILISVRKQIGGGVSLRIIGPVGDEITRAKNLEPSLSPAMRMQISDLSTEFQQRSHELFQTAGSEVQREVDGLVEHARRELDKMDRRSQFDDWRDSELPRLKRNLSETARSCPAECTEAMTHITQARIRLQALADAQETKFRDQFEAVRERAATQTQVITDTLKGEVRGLIERMRGRNFTSRDEAKKFIDTTPAVSELTEEIRLLADRNRDASQELQRSFEVAVSNFLDEVERKGNTITGGDGRGMAMFGNKAFPIFEAPVAKKQPKKTTLVFQQLKNQPAVGRDDLIGDIAMHITASHGQEQTLRAWEGLKHEDELRYGRSTFRDTAQPSYVSQKEFLAVKKNFADWKSRKKGGLKERYEKLRADVKAHYKIRVKPDPLKPGDRGSEDDAWKAEHQRLLGELSEFIGTHQIPVLQRLEAIENAPEPEYANGKGLVPEWQNHWVTAPEDEKMLEKMATYFEMQSKLQEGMLNLKGHAGTGKDVLMKMFAERAKRPYFGFDCTKWTTESDLSEDIVLESVNGAPQTVYVPSAVVNAIQTPGAILYFNEWNAMPESAQVFMHSLLDEKRSMTLKTRSGKVIKAHPTVLIASSMNPGYAGTFAPQMATRSRIVDLEVDYPPLLREPDDGDTNPNKPYSVSEALKIASSVPSLAKATLGRNMKHNEFVKWWDHEINGIGDAPALTTSQKFDIQAINALVQISDKLREAFKKQYSGTPTEKTELKKTLPVTAPITLREMRRCGYMLGEMTDEEKVKGDPENVAKQLIESFFLSHIDNATDRATILTTMKTMPYKQKRLAA